MKGAVRYALCGTGDQIVRNADGTHVRSKGCGHPLCPRCGRKGGGKYVRRVKGWLAHAPHGELFNVCFTQMQVKGESLADARKRLSKKLRSMMRWLERTGMTAAMTVHHAAVSGRRDLAGTWHYHCHGIIEMPAGRFVTQPAPYRDGRTLQVCQELSDKWREFSIKHGEEAENVEACFNHRMLDAGSPIASLIEDSGDAEFWSESKDEVARLVQYPMRDMAQGVSAWRMGDEAGVMAARVDELCRTARHWKMRRAWGKWRARCPEEKAFEDAKSKKEVDADTDEDAAEGKAAPGPAEPLGTCRGVWLKARGGDRESIAALHDLEKGCRNKTRFATRLVAWVRSGLRNVTTGGS